MCERQKSTSHHPYRKTGNAPAHKMIPPKPPLPMAQKGSPLVELFRCAGGHECIIGVVLALDSSRWNELRSAYGPAGKITELLRQLRHAAPAHTYQSEPYFSLWSALCHQGKISTASYAAFPYLMKLINEKPLTTDWSVLQLAMCIEVARLKGRGPEMPEDLKLAYFESLAKTPKIIEAAILATDPNYLIILNAAAAIVNGEIEKAEVILDGKQE